MSWFHHRDHDDDPSHAQSDIESDLTPPPTSLPIPSERSVAATQSGVSPTLVEVSAALDAFIEAPDWHLTRQVLEERQSVLLTLDACLEIIRRVGHSSSAHNRGILSTCACLLLIAFDRGIPAAWEWLEDRQQAYGAFNAAMKMPAYLPPEQATEEFRRTIDQLPQAQRQHANDILAETALEAEDNSDYAQQRSGELGYVMGQPAHMPTPMHPVTPTSPSVIPSPTDQQRQWAEMLLAQTVGQLDEALRRGLLAWLGKPGISATPQEITAAYSVFLAATGLAHTQEPSASTNERPSEDVHFTAFYPRIVAGGIHYTLAVYTHLESALSSVRQDVLRFSDEMSNAPVEVGASAAQPLARGIDLTIVPECDGISFNPEYITFRWIRDSERVTFDFVADEQLVGHAVNAEVSIYAGPLIIGILQLPLLCEKQNTSMSNQDPVSSATSMLRHVFASYSHDDEAIVIACRNAYQALGLQVLIDRDTLQAGENWEPAIDEMIRKADVFQLFWSPRSARSPYVQHEWRFALQLQRSNTFIRPVYWEKPRVPVPVELSALNFKYMPLAHLDETPGLREIGNTSQAANTPLQPTQPTTRRRLFGLFKRRSPHPTRNEKKHVLN